MVARRPRRATLAGCTVSSETTEHEAYRAASHNPTALRGGKKQPLPSGRSSSRRHGPPTACRDRQPGADVPAVSAAGTGPSRPARRMNGGGPGPPSMPRSSRSPDVRENVLSGRVENPVEHPARDVGKDPVEANYSGPRKLDHQLSYSGGPGKGSDGRQAQNHTPAFKAQVALAAVKADHTVNERAAQHGVHPTLIPHLEEATARRRRGRVRQRRARRGRGGRRGPEGRAVRADRPTQDGAGVVEKSHPLRLTRGGR